MKTEKQDQISLIGCSAKVLCERKKKIQEVLKYHIDYGHFTEHCRELYAFLEGLIKGGKLKEYIQKDNQKLGKNSQNKDKRPQSPNPRNSGNVERKRHQFDKCRIWWRLNGKEQKLHTPKRLCQRLHPKPKGKGCFRMIPCISLRMIWITC